MAENTKSACDSGSLRIYCELGSLGEINTQNMAISHREESPTSDSFVVDLGSLSHGNGADKDITASSRITVKMPRSLSRKGSQQIGAADGSSNGGNKTANCFANGSNAEKLIISHLAPVETKEPITTTTQAHQINITSETKCRRYSRQRSSARLINPGRVLFFFATLSSMGTIILIYFTLSIARHSGDGNSTAQM